MEVQMTVLMTPTGIANPVEACWLRRHGSDPAEERSPQLPRGSDGHTVDPFVSAVQVVGWMQLLPASSEARTHRDAVVLQGPDHPPVEEGAHVRGDAVRTLAEDGDAVHVGFEHGGRGATSAGSRAVLRDPPAGAPGRPPLRTLTPTGRS
jgi:hypothetical protein